MNFRRYSVVVSAVLFATALPAAAQEVTCGAIGEGGLWMGGDAGASNVSNAGAPLSMTGMSVPAGGRMIGFFSVSAPGEVRVEAAPSELIGDTVLELYDESGTMIVTDDDSGGDLASRAELRLEPGTYCLAARAFGGGAVTADLQVSRIEQEALTEGLAGGFIGTESSPPFVGIDACTASTAATMLWNTPLDPMLPQGVEATNTISGVPYYRFTLTSPQPVTIRAQNPAADPYIYIFDGFGNLLAENDDYDSLNSRVDFTTPLQPGDYCIGMRALSDDNLPVTVSVAGFDAQAVATEQYATGEVAPLDGSYPVMQIGPLPSRSVRDSVVRGGQAVWYAMDVDDFGLLLITADEVTDSDPVITFFDETGRMVGMNDDANGTLNSQLAVPVSPGRYMLAVRQYSQGYQGIIRIGIERYVPAP